jgi:hypothetical protein
MVKLQTLKVAALLEGFIKVRDVADGSVMWFTSALPDVDTNFHKRLCLDSLTNSATIYWETIGAKIHSETFRTVSSFQEWLGLHPIRMPSHTAA